MNSKSYSLNLSTIAVTGQCLSCICLIRHQQAYTRSESPCYQLQYTKVNDKDLRLTWIKKIKTPSIWGFKETQHFSLNWSQFKDQKRQPFKVNQLICSSQGSHPSTCCFLIISLEISFQGLPFSVTGFESRGVCVCPEQKSLIFLFRTCKLQFKNKIYRYGEGKDGEWQGMCNRRMSRHKRDHLWKYISDLDIKKWRKKQKVSRDITRGKCLWQKI